LCRLFEGWRQQQAKFLRTGCITEVWLTTRRLEIVRLISIHGLGPLVGIGGAGSEGRSLALGYSGEFARRSSRYGTCAFISPHSEPFRQPPILVVIWLTADKSTAKDLQAWSRRLDRDPSRVVLGICIGDTPEPSWLHRVVCLPGSGPGGRSLTAALDCIAEMLLVSNLRNLRIHELRDVLAEGSELKFAAGWADGETCVQAALQAALSEPALDGRLGAIRGIWMHVSASSMPLLGELFDACEALELRCRAPTVTWGGATESPSVSSSARVSLLAVLSGEPGRG
jgi:hypothetical protein